MRISNKIWIIKKVYGLINLMKKVLVTGRNNHKRIQYNFICYIDKFKRNKSVFKGASMLAKLKIERKNFQNFNIENANFNK